MPIRLYLDEDAQSGSLTRALRERGVDVLTADEAGLRGRADAEHLAYASAQGRALYSFNISDYNRLHYDYLVAGQTHAGIILAPQQRYRIGEQMRRLLRIINTLTTEQMREQLEFLKRLGLSGWLALHVLASSFAALRGRRHFYVWHTRIHQS